ncbi:MAG: histidine kinase [Aeromicrobium sp.]
MDKDRLLARFDPWSIAGVAITVIALVVGGVSALVADAGDSTNQWAIVAVGAVGLYLAVRASNLAVVAAAVLVALVVLDPAPWGTWCVAAGLLFLYALRRPRFDAVAAGVVVAGAALGAAYAPGLDGGPGGFGLVAMAAAMVGGGQWVQAQRRYVVAESGRRRQESERRREEVARHVAEERLRIARELHDSVAHHLAVVSVHTNVARANLSRSPEKAERALDDVQNATQSVLEELGVVLGVLRASEDEIAPPTPVDADLLDDLLGSFRGIGLQVTTDGLEHLLLLAPVAGRAAQRLLQESLTNAHRYGDGAVSVTVSPPSEGYITLTVRNAVASTAPAPASTGSGLGLVGMRERVHLLGGTFHAAPDAGSFVVTAQLPAAAPQSPREEPR